MIRLENISKTFFQGETRIEVLNNLSLSVEEGKKVAIIGPSGSGKSTLLSVMSGMDRPDSGKVFIDGENIVTMSETALCNIRNQKVGIIFQAFELIPSFTALENVLLPMDIADKADIQKSRDLMSELGLSHRTGHLPRELSGGEQQRVAIARALINDPKIIFADEPTGNLDSHTGEKVISIFFEQIEKYKKTLLLITHDQKLAEKMDKIYKLEDGKLHEVKSSYI